MQFTKSQYLSLGLELELQLINKYNFDLTPKATEFLEHFSHSRFRVQVVPEITQSMIELNSSVHQHPATLLAELKLIRDDLVSAADSLGVNITGGGSHHFQMWNDRKIFPDAHYKMAEKKYGYLAKMFTVFGMHIHIGCTSGDDAIYLMNILPRYMSHFIALSASSPFCQGVDTDFDSSRSNVVSMFPLSGLAPVMPTWQAFCEWIEKAKYLKIVEKINNFYWDVRPKPEFGTVEIRVCDTPLTIERATLLAAYAQCLARYILEERRLPALPHDLLLYNCNRYQASYHGFNAFHLTPEKLDQCTLKDDILQTIQALKPHAKALGSEHYLHLIENLVHTENNDANTLRKQFQQGISLPEIIQWQTQLFANKVLVAETA